MRFLSQIEIATLSQAQQAQLAAYGTRWEALRSATAPPDDHAAALTWVHQAYGAAGLPPPREIIWEQDPAQLAAGWASGRGAAGDNVRALVVDLVRRKAEQAFDRAISLQVRVTLAGEPGLVRTRPFCASIDEAVLRLGERALPILRMRLADLFRRRTRLSFGACGFSLQSAPWLGAAEYLHNVCGLEQHTKALTGLWQLARRACWMLPHGRVCWLLERPRLIRVDAAARLHATDGPALRFGETAKVYAWKGILVPAWLIEQRECIDVRCIDAAQDPQVRRCMIDIMTPKRFVEEGGAYAVARDDTGVLWRKRWRWEAWAAVEVVNGTPEPDGTHKHYFLQVPATVRTPREAVAWTYGLSERHYRPLMRT
jgi:hypothetical protein